MVSNAASIAALVAVEAAIMSSSETEDLVELVDVPALGDTQELTEAPENFLTKPFDEYNTTEGLLVIIVLLLVLSFLGNFFGRCISWL